MNITEIVIGDRALAQRGTAVREIVEIKGIDEKKGEVIIRLSDGRITEIHPQYILKSFGRL